MTSTETASVVLVVDDDDTFRQVMAKELHRRGYVVTSAATGREALQRAVCDTPDVVLLDLHMPEVDGIEVLKELREREVAAEVIVLTGHGTIDTAIKAIRLGAYDYLEKPCPIAKVDMTIQKACEHLELLARQRVLQDGYAPPDVRSRFIGRSEAFSQLRRDIARIARTDSTTLIAGETGAGKDMVATLLHTLSPRSEGPLVIVDCGALHEDLLQSELFGHEKGAFSGATRLKHGLFEVADGGTLFLDEVGDTSPEMQAKLLRVLETGRFRRVGGTQEIVVDVRLVSATNRDLEQAIASGRFREDLYFRLAVLTIGIPPLRERKEDIPLLVDHFTARLNKRMATTCRFDDEALRLMVEHPWPGNVRELIHVVEQAILLADDDVIGPADLAPALGKAWHSSEVDAKEELGSLEDVQKKHILRVLNRTSGNRAEAARTLGISERNLYRLIHKFGAEAASPKGVLKS